MSILGRGTRFHHFLQLTIDQKMKTNYYFSWAYLFIGFSCQPKNSDLPATPFSSHLGILKFMIPWWWIIWEFDSDGYSVS